MQSRPEPRAQGEAVGGAPEQHSRAPSDRVVERRAEKVSDRVGYEKHGREFQGRPRRAEPEREDTAHEERPGERTGPLAGRTAEREVSADPTGGVREEGESEEHVEPRPAPAPGGQRAQRPAA